MEFQRLLSLIHDDFSHIVRRMDRTIVGLYASRRERWCFIMFCNLPPSTCYGKFYGAQSLLGLVAQQFQFGRTKIKKGGKVFPFTHSLLHKRVITVPYN